MNLAALRSAWNDDGYFFLRGLIDAAQVKAIVAEVVAAIRADPPERHPGEAAYLSNADYYIFPEKQPSPTAMHVEDRISKVFNCHTSGSTRAVAERKDLADIAAALLGVGDVDCFQSQFIFKNPGVIGQPWHQDSYYFRFDRQPQIGVWLALSEATLQNGCLWVVPGSHRSQTIFEHVPDRRPAANRGYEEIINQDVSTRVPALMQPGDVLFFHSYLMHQSTDNVANVRRAAMVYHYGAAGTRGLTPAVDYMLQNVNRWIPVRRESSPRNAAGAASAHSSAGNNLDGW